ncbi:MAG: circularly permuted type 2 ATP-grasp protein [Burkholderiaceae bacterium]
MSREALVTGYPAHSERYDELFGATGAARLHWRTLLEHLLDIGPQALDARHREVTRLLRENGVTYNIYADPEGLARPWDLDLLPMIVSAAEWEGIEAAVIQRATLLNRILADIYGSQSLVCEGRLPAALVHGHRGFLRPCHGIEQNRQTPLHIYAADLARSPDGRWWVLGDRTQGPTGAGYALENRLAIARAFPDLFRTLNVQRLASFMSTLRESLAARAPRTDATEAARLLGLARADAPDDPPLIVLLTPGPYSETYSEQAFLARYLGFPLVVGGDLTVRQGFVWLKTLSGLQRVSVILRRLDDDFCDPLELRADSALGVPGLTEAFRRGNVVIANGLGSGLLESGTLLGYLPSLARHVLGEALRLPSIATWWCGEPAALEDAIERLDSLVIKPAFPQSGERPVFGKDLADEARLAFIAKLRARPQNYVAQEMVKLSRAPTWQQIVVGNAGEGLGAGLGTGVGVGAGIGAGVAASRPPRPGQREDRALQSAVIGLRVFACAFNDSYVVMPGGLTRVASGPDDRVLSMQMGGASKDTWVLASGNVSHLTLLPSEEAVVHPVRGDERLASRTVENLYWFGRYCERVDNVARLLRRTFDTLLGASADERGADWRTLIELCRWFELIDEKVGPLDGRIQSHLLAAVFTKRPQCLPDRLRTLYDVSSRLHERLSLDNWRVLNQMIQRLATERSQTTVDAALKRLDEATVVAMTLSGFALDGMTRDLGWRFMSLGRRIERYLYMCTVLSKALSLQQTGANLDWLLEIGDSIATYRARYVASAQWPLLLDLLVMDETNPRSIAFQLEGMIQATRKLAALDSGRALGTLEPLMKELQALQRGGRLRKDSAELMDWLVRAGSAGYRLSDDLCNRFFSYSGPDIKAAA